MHLPTNPAALRRLRQPTLTHPWRVLVSACMVGTKCGTKGDDNGMGTHRPLQHLLGHSALTPVPYCPEHLAYGTPRGMPDLYDGDGFDVLAGRAKVRLDAGDDATEQLLTYARSMATLAETCDFAILVDMSAACGTQVISAGDRTRADRQYQNGPGLVAALLWKAHIPFMAQRDHKTLAHLQAMLSDTTIDDTLVDHHRSPWFLENFPEGPWSRTERALQLRPEVSTRRPVYKVLPAAIWAERGDTVPWTEVDHQDGFLHLSAEHQLARTLELHFAGQTNLVTLKLDPARIPELVWEASRNGDLFPHAYGATPSSAVVEAG